MRFISSNYLSFTSGGLEDSHERLRISSSGSVGIGTSSPSAILDVEKNFNGTTSLEISNSSTGNLARRGISIGNGSVSNSVFLISTSPNYDEVISWSNAGILGTDSQLSNGLIMRTAAGKIRFQPNGTTDKVVIDANGNVGIGISSPTQKLQVAGTVYSTEVKVELAAGQGPDYVFEPDYDLRTLQETKAYISENRHLPEIPSAKEMEEKGVDLGDMNMRLLKKIEELTLHQIELMEELQSVKKELKELKSSGK